MRSIFSLRGWGRNLSVLCEADVSTFTSSVQRHEWTSTNPRSVNSSVSRCSASFAVTHCLYKQRAKIKNELVLVAGSLWLTGCSFDRPLLTWDYTVTLGHGQINLSGAWSPGAPSDHPYSPRQTWAVLYVGKIIHQVQTGPWDELIRGLQPELTL